MSDVIKLESPAGEQELQWLKSLKVGDSRLSPLMDAIPADLVWTCVTATVDKEWVLEGRFCDVPVMRLRFAVGESAISVEQQVVPDV